MAIESDTLLSPQQLSEYLEVPVAALYAWRHRDTGPPAFRVGRHLRYRWIDVEQWIAGQLIDGERKGHAQQRATEE